MLLKYILLFLLFFPLSAQGSDLIISEIAWMGTENSPNDEWIELYNNGSGSVNLEGWLLEAEDGTPKIKLSGKIFSKGFYLLERTDDDALPEISADLIYKGALSNKGEILKLFNNSGKLVDEVKAENGWPAGDNSTKQTMERINSSSSKNSSLNWQTSDNPGGTPKAQNSSGYQMSRPLLFKSQSQPKPKPKTKSKAEPKLESETPPAEKQRQKPKSFSEPKIQITKTQLPAYPPGILINEIVPSPEGPDSENEWLELANINNIEVSLSGWKIKDAIGSVKTYTFPKKAKISAQGFLLLRRPITNIILNNSGDTLKLFQPDGKTADIVSFGKAPTGQSYNRVGSEWIWSVNLTPGSPNVVSAFQSSQKKADPKKSEPEIQKNKNSLSFKTEKGLAAANKQIPENSKSLFVFLIAFAIAAVSGTIILILKKKLAKEKLI